MNGNEIGRKYGLQYAPNTRETVRDEAMKYFVEEGLAVRNPDDPGRPTNIGKRRRELKALFAGFRTGLIFVTAFEDRAAMGRFLDQISWETDVWIADNPDHIVHFNGDRFFGPYPDTMPATGKA